MAQKNPYLNVMVQSDITTALVIILIKYNLWQMDPSGKLKDR
jgi:hypothetical protein